MKNTKRLQDTRCPLFSIILPVYQNQDTLTRCIDSVIGQREQNYEIILVDDGSTDESGTICDKFADQYSRSVSVIHKRNEGPLQARIEGIGRAHGEYLLFLDADDTYVPGMLRKLADVIKSQKADIIIFNYYRCYENGKSELNKPLYTDNQVFEEKGKQKLYEELITGFQLNALWQKCIRREVMGELNDFRRLGRMVIGEDKLLSMGVIDRAEKIVYLADGLYNYRIAQSSISHRLSVKHYEDMNIVHRRTLEYMKHWKMDEYKALCCMRKAEFGLSCLYSVAGEVQAQKKSFTDFETLALCIVSDKAYWNAAALCGEKLSLRKRMLCRLLQNNRIKTVFLLMCIGDLMKRVSGKNLI